MNVPQDTDPHLGRRPKSAFGSWPRVIAASAAPERLEEPVRELLTEVKACAARLAELTGWDRDKLLDKAGCTATRRREPEELLDELLERCFVFLQWIEAAVEKLDTLPERRLVVSGAAKLLKQADKDVDLMVEVARQGEYSCLVLLRLGELGFAWQEARRHLPGAAGERARRLRLHSPYGVGAPHLSRGRVQMLVDDPAQLGDRTAGYMIEHLERCKACAAAYPHALEHATACR